MWKYVCLVDLTLTKLRLVRAPDTGNLLLPNIDHEGTHSSTQSGAPDAEPSHMSEVGHGINHPSTFDAASPGNTSLTKPGQNSIKGTWRWTQLLVEDQSRSHLSIGTQRGNGHVCPVGKHLALPGATPSQHPVSNAGYQLPFPPGVGRWPRWLPRSNWSNQSTNPPCIPSTSGEGSYTRNSAVGEDTHVSNDGRSTPPNATLGEQRRSAYIRSATIYIKMPASPRETPTVLLWAPLVLVRTQMVLSLAP